MTAVGLLATMPGTGSGEADTRGRASADSGSSFGDALTAAGQVLDGVSDSGTAMLDPARQSGPTAETSTAPDRTIDPQAAIAAMTHLVAWSAPMSSEPSAVTLQATTPQATTSATTLPGEMTPDATIEMTPGVAGAEATPVDPASGVIETDAADAVPAAAVSASASATLSAPASASAAVAGGRGELRTVQDGPLGDVRAVGVDTAATPHEPAGGGADPSLSDPDAAALRPEPLLGSRRLRSRPWSAAL